MASLIAHNRHSGLAKCIYPTSKNRPASYLTVVTARSAGSQMITAALLRIDPAINGWTRILGGEEYYSNYHDAMAQILVPLEQQMSMKLAYVIRRQSSASVSLGW